ncbi:hypothetical protein NV226_00040 [Mycoplasma iguanae]|uniref:High affinity transport system protein p37 n=1 Tax=Mycoplasma iguanae TaxID=292461 RepID=A0ABY5RA93_9MOLU|nr:hypothetical protein [Mycoplasma iguanae]UVD81699.1 hypothetical protein NV226_00040 [Mycoplasma iguanae]
MKLKKFLLFPLAITAIGMFIACAPQQQNEGQWQTKVTMSLNQAWWDDKDSNQNKIDEFIKIFKTEFQKLKNQNPEWSKLPDVEFSIINNTEDNLTLQNVQNNKSDFAIISSTHALNANPENRTSKAVQLKLQTLTKAFNFDDGTESDPFKIAQNMQELFDKKPFEEWELTTEQWSGSTWNFLYDTKKTVDFYRGQISIVGTEEIRKEIKAAWNAKDWNKFRNFGILHIENLKLFEKTLKEHFNNSFTSLEADKLQNPDKYSKGYLKDIGQKSGFAISLDNEAPFAWEKNKNVDAQETDKKFTTKTGEKIDFLTVTDKHLYDIGIFKKNFNSLQADLIVQTFINLAKNQQDIYGPNVGYNGYKKYVDQ